MLARSAAVAFLATTDAPRARAFYERVLGLRFVEDDGFALIFDMSGTALRIARVERLSPQPFMVLGWYVDDLDPVVAALDERGARLERYPGLDQDARGVWRSPSGMRVGWFRDPDGNTLSVSGFR